VAGQPGRFPPKRRCHGSDQNDSARTEGGTKTISPNRAEDRDFQEKTER